MGGEPLRAVCSVFAMDLFLRQEATHGNFLRSRTEPRLGAARRAWRGGPDNHATGGRRFDAALLSSHVAHERPKRSVLMPGEPNGFLDSPRETLSALHG
jgi:hypothetical protein